MPTQTVKAAFFDIGETLATSNRQWVNGAKDVLAKLRTKGVRLGVISDTSTMTRAQVLQLLPTDFNFNMFEAALVILSSEVGVTKSSPAIFELAVSRAALKPAECLFCTETLEHTLTAQAVGLRVARTLLPPASDIGGLPQSLTKAGLI
jgi:FMN phosphatase YigB (HAD superfamily)